MPRSPTSSLSSATAPSMPLPSKSVNPQRSTSLSSNPLSPTSHPVMSLSTILSPVQAHDSEEGSSSSHPMDLPGKHSSEDIAITESSLAVAAHTSTNFSVGHALEQSSDSLCHPFGSPDSDSSQDIVIKGPVSAYMSINTALQTSQETSNSPSHPLDTPGTDSFQDHHHRVFSRCVSPHVNQLPSWPCT